MFSGGRAEGDRDREFGECLTAAQGDPTELGNPAETLSRMRRPKHVLLVVSSPLRGLVARPAPTRGPRLHRGSGRAVPSDWFFHQMWFATSLCGAKDVVLQDLRRLLNMWFCNIFVFAEDCGLQYRCFG